MVTTFLSVPKKVFTKEDFPAFGWPKTVILGTSSSNYTASGSISFTSSSNNSPVPLPFIEEIENKAGKPRL